MARLGRPGLSSLSVRVYEAPLYSSHLRAGNDKSPAVGSEGGRLGLTHLNLTGRGDTFTMGGR